MGQKSILHQTRTNICIKVMKAKTVDELIKFLEIEAKEFATWLKVNKESLK